MSEVTALPRPAPLRPARAGAAFLVAAAVAGAVLGRTGPSAWDVVAAATAGLLVWVAAIDLETRLLPNRLVVPATIVVLLACALFTPDAFVEHALAALAAGGFLFVAAVIRPNDLGMGDVKLAVLLGALLGRGVLQALVIGFCLVAAVGIVLLVRDGRAAMKRQLPLGPFLAFGAVVALLITGAN
jgi:leader peptidase (prepilin peptidase) / N-methyltransferase